MKYESINIDLTKLALSLSTIITSDISHVLVAPLNWGLGHATRCMPIIDILLSEGKVVTIASDGEALTFLQEEYPQLTCVELPSYRIRYNSQNTLSIIRSNCLNIFSAIRSEYKAAKQIADSIKPDLIISDSRFGCKHSYIPSYIISHQLSLHFTSSLIRFTANKINTHLLNSFDKCLVPDNESNLSGKLSHNAAIKNQIKIGPLSRMKKYEQKIKYDIAVILSGPEPARTKLETSLFLQLQSSKLKVIAVRGTSTRYEGPEYAFEIINRANSTLINDILMSSKLVISRSGYSSIMDYAATDSQAILIPTPGQPEQEYLAHHLSEDPKYTMLSEEKLNSKNFSLNLWLNKILDHTFKLMS